MTRDPEARPGQKSSRRRSGGTFSTLARRQPAALLGIASLWTLAASSALTGALAFFAPRTFYDDFPAGLALVAQLPPFNAHLTTDVGGFYLAFALLFAWAALRPSRQLVVPLAAAWILEAGLHLVWHLLHLDGFSTDDAIAQTAGFVVWLILPVAAWRAAGQPRSG